MEVVHDLEGDAFSGQDLDLLATATEDKRVPAFQAQHPFSLCGQIGHQATDLFLTDTVKITLLAHVYALRVLSDQCHDVIADQTIEEHDIGQLHQPERPECQQIGIPGTGTDEIDLAVPFAGLGLIVSERRAQQGDGPVLVTGEDLLR